jgi:hypothetical protein
VLSARKEESPQGLELGPIATATVAHTSGKAKPANLVRMQISAFAQRCGVSVHEGAKKPDQWFPLPTKKADPP